ncbi:hypothetical protein HGQ17_08200 [Nesterenkonia sp. MY13]|uniref:Uncharacterized protein n=1 Tax=Nesterenkonia sedimenti TaxID=1463632 RepID=A0A7X8TJT6_9MICC|nr:hypothetical protein [Nesterenkonia sedimenti]NLS09978.1 hypothetical protein [Nesterenkonia sedimenti]
MAVELALLSEVAPDDSAVALALGDIDPQGKVVAFDSMQMRLLVESTQEPLLAIYSTRHVEVPDQVRQAVENPPEAFGLWTDLVIPYGADELLAREAAETLAARVGGSVHSRR